MEAGAIPTKYQSIRRLEAHVESKGTSLSTWMGDLMPYLENDTLLDLSLPGVHDALTCVVLTIRKEMFDRNSLLTLRF